MYDHGERFEKHGFYNILVFLAIFIPLNMALAIFYALWCKVENFLVYFTAASFITAIVASVLLVHYRRLFDQGLFGTLQYSSEECNWVGRNIPFVDLLPSGTQNFWAGSMYCKPETIKIKASIDTDGVLKVDCGGKHVGNVYIDVLPETREWPLRDKDMWHRYNHLVLDRSVRLTTDNNTRAMYIGEVLATKSNPLPIWAYYRDRGYVTARVETGCDDWANEYVGNKYTSDSFSVGNRSLDYELTSPFCLPEYYPNVGNAFGNFKGPYSIKARCLYGRYVHDWAFDYLRQLRQEFRFNSHTKNSNKKPYMITATFLEGHEGTGEVLRTLDDSLATFIEEFRDSGELENTVLIIGADHGLHMGLNFAFLQNGRIEHQNPFMALSVPEWLYQFSEDYQETFGSEKISPFKANEQRLTTPLEMHYTFRVLSDWPHFDTENWDRSLFAAQKAGRTCEEAGIGANFCMCKHRTRP
ncbi:hypothetical protein FB639_001659 [Coemansia asiatica]|nr:hypothetical protein FB639_001659 [Coemansia asiatica]